MFRRLSTTAAALSVSSTQGHATTAFSFLLAPSSALRHCATTKPVEVGSPDDKTFRDANVGAAAAKAAKAQEARWSAKPETVPGSSSTLKQTTLEESQQQAEQQQGAANTTTAELWCSAPTLYRRFIKLILRKFGDHPEVAVRSWKQLKYEMIHFRDAPPSEVPALIHRGKMIHQAVMGGVIPVVRDEKTGLSYCKYDKETLEAAGGVVDPISAEEFLRRNHNKLDKEELHELKGKLKEAGRWSGPDEFRPEDLPKIKTKRKVKCTDPDE